jgi:hypothetical protein
MRTNILALVALLAFGITSAAAASYDGKWEAAGQGTTRSCPDFVAHIRVAGNKITIDIGSQYNSWTTNGHRARWVIHLGKRCVYCKRKVPRRYGRVHSGIPLWTAHGQRSPRKLIGSAKASSCVGCAWSTLQCFATVNFCSASLRPWYQIWNVQMPATTSQPLSKT